jgi:hypothetical protein
MRGFLVWAVNAAVKGNVRLHFSRQLADQLYANGWDDDSDGSDHEVGLAIGNGLNHCQRRLQFWFHLLGDSKST